MRASVIICTRNRAESLRRTLESMAAVRAPEGFITELLIVDNGSTDGTAEVVKRSKASAIPIKYVLEPKPGLSNARNAGLAAANGEVILFTDDDVAPELNWLEKIAAPLANGKCEGVVGRVKLAESARRPWFTTQHEVWLAEYDGPGESPLQLVGANMGFHRRVLDKVPAFDPELGAGARGFAEETLFSWQLEEAGFRLSYAPEAEVIHSPDVSRMSRSHWLQAARRHGISSAYILHHWEHKDLPGARMRFCNVGLKLMVRRIAQPSPIANGEGIAAWEMSYVAEMEKCRGFLKERNVPRKYTRRGLRKLEQ